MANKTGGAYRDKRTPGVNHVRDQYRHYVVEGGNVVAADILDVLLEQDEHEGGQPLVSLTAWSHNGGMVTPAAATQVTSDGDTIVFEFHYPQIQPVRTDRDRDDQPNYTEVVHTLAGVTGGAATAVQIVASLNADADFKVWGFAAVSATNVVKVFPIGPDSHVRIGIGSTSVVAGLFGQAVFNDARTFTQLNPSEYLMTYTPGTTPKKVVVTKTGATVVGLAVVVSAH